MTTARSDSGRSIATFAIVGLTLGLAPVIAEPLTLERALAEARVANATLPAPRLDLQIAEQRRIEAEAARRAQISFEGDFLFAPGGGYDPVVSNIGHDRLQLVARRSLYNGGALRAAITRASADAAGAAARFRIAEADLDLAVRTQFAAVLSAGSEIEARERGLERLKSYRTWLASLKASGQGVAADLLKTDLRLQTDQIALVDAESRAEQARITLADLMGRDPTSPLELAALPAPAPPGLDPAAAWESTPDVQAAAAATASAAAALEAAKAEKSLHLDAQADVGFWGSDTSHWTQTGVEPPSGDAALGRLQRDFGGSVGLTFALPIFDFGAIRARIAEAELGREQSGLQEEAARRQARLQWTQAHAALASLYRQIAALSEAVPRARDVYLDVESRYRGGAATALDVLDAASDAVDTAVSLGGAVERYRDAEALAIRWGGSATP